MATIGIPYAMACEKCYVARICPICGEHLTERARIVKGQGKVGGESYGAHYARLHTEDPGPGAFADKRIGC